MANIVMEEALGRGTGRYFPGISYIPDHIEVAEDRDLMVKIYLEFVDFLKCTADLLDLMHLLKNRNIRTTFTIPHNVLREMIALGDKGRLFKEFDRKVQDIIVGVTSSLDSVIRRGTTGNRSRTAFLPILHKADTGQTPATRFNMSVQADLIEITGKKTKPIWHNVAMEKEDFLNTKLVDQPRSLLSVDEMVFPCKYPSKDIKRSPSEILQYSLKFCLQSQIPASTPKFRHQMDMMLASKAGFGSVEAHKAYLATKKAQWYRDFVHDTVKLGLLGCQEVMHAFERLGKHYDMTRDSLPFAKVKLCLIVQSLPFWDVGRLHTQRAIEFILERILHIEPDEEQPLKEWLKVRKIPYVVIHPFSAEDFMKRFASDDPVEIVTGVNDVKPEETSYQSVEKLSLTEDQGKNSPGE